MDLDAETVTIEHVRYIVTKDPTNDRIISIFPDIQELKDKIDSLESTISDLESTINHLR